MYDSQLAMICEVLETLVLKGLVSKSLKKKHHSTENYAALPLVASTYRKLGKTEWNIINDSRGWRSSS